MTLVIDASAAYGLFLGTQRDTFLESDGDLIAPDLIVAELLNARWKMARTGRAAPAVESMLDFLARIRIMPSLSYAATAAQLSIRMNHPIYDCLYVAIAQQESMKLLTSDAQLARKLRLHKLGAILA
jgi:predicted nucleic acid-binding protein